jgi:hypothetical protein
MTAARQNWVLDPLQDQLFIIAAPLLSLAFALLLVMQFGVERGGTMVITAHVILTVAHHLPTFIRIYGDHELMRRYRWSFLLGPVVPLAFALAVLAYLHAQGLPVEYVLYLYLFLALWDPWHFLRQHFGFMRIYDRGNAAPVQLASGMDWWLCTAWFVHIMVASSEWIPGVLEDLYRSAGIPLLLWLPAGGLQVAAGVSAVLASTMTLVYAGYLFWCVRRGWFVSSAKLALLCCTFGVMYLTYTPNSWMQSLAPGWGFKLGFATVGIVHMTQYLAIVWRYDQRLAAQQRARPGVFQWLHARRTASGVVLAAMLYVGLCIAYGDLVTTRPENRWLLSLVLAVGFVSTLLHYYYDGFIWKIRHRENRQALDLPTAVGEGMSWGASQDAPSARSMFARQLLYFGLPLGLLTFGAVHAWQSDRTPYVAHMVAAQQFADAGDMATASEAARHAAARMQQELPIVRQMAALQPTAAREAELAFLLFNAALYQEQVLPSLDGARPDMLRAQRLSMAVMEAADWLQSALGRGGALAHPGRDTLTREQAEAVLHSWRSRVVATRNAAAKVG